MSANTQKTSDTMVSVVRHIAITIVSLLFATVSLPVLAGERQAISIFVSILPQKYFVQQVAGDDVEVNVMVGPGKSPETYEPSPRQMEKLNHAAVYFRMGLPFEDAWMKKVKSQNPGLIIIDARDGIKLRNISEADSRSDGMKDPHIWTNPMNVAEFMRYFTVVLASRYPQKKTFFEGNLLRFAAQLEDLDNKIRLLFKPSLKKYLLVYHPSWGYFAQQYGLTQISIEVEGNPPNAKALAAVIEFAKQNNLRTVFTQKQFSQSNAQVVANAIGGRVIAVDPLAEDYLNNMLYVAQQFAGSMQ